MRQLQMCVRCGKVVDAEFDDVDDFEAIELDSGEVGIVCSSCLTGAEVQAMDEEMWPE